MSDMEFAWLIESGDGRYWSGHSATKFSFDKNREKAIRFSRKEDAEFVIYHLLDELSFGLKSVEHGFTK